MDLIFTIDQSNDKKVTSFILPVSRTKKIQLKNLLMAIIAAMKSKISLEKILKIAIFDILVVL